MAEGWSLFDSFYFSVITLPTIGYGDLSPSTTAGKIFTIVYIFVGLGIILGFVNAIAERSTEGRRRVLARRQSSEGARSNHQNDDDQP